MQLFVCVFNSYLLSSYLDLLSLDRYPLMALQDRMMYTLMASLNLLKSYVTISLYTRRREMTLFGLSSIKVSIIGSLDLQQTEAPTKDGRIAL